MPTVIGINQVPYGLPAQPGFRANLGNLSGTVSRQVTDALLAALTLGQYQGQPTPGNPGTMTFPSGMSTPTSPMEQAQIHQMGGVPTRNGGVGPTQQMTPTGQGGVTYQPPMTMGIKPTMDWQLKQAQLQKAQQDLDPNSPMNQYLRALTSQAHPSPSGDGTGAGGAGGENEFLQGLSSLSQAAQAGDEKAVQKIRLIRQLMSSP